MKYKGVDNYWLHYFAANLNVNFICNFCLTFTNIFSYISYNSVIFHLLVCDICYYLKKCTESLSLDGAGDVVCMIL